MYPLIARLAMDREMEIRRQAAMPRSNKFVNPGEKIGSRFARSKPIRRWLAWFSRRQRRQYADCC